jgi:hypothetical protein
MTAASEPKEEPVYNLHVDAGTAGESAAGRLLGRYPNIEAALDALDEHAEHVWQNAAAGRGEIRYLVLADTPSGQRRAGGGSSFWAGPPGSGQTDGDSPGTTNAADRAPEPGRDRS